MNKKNFDKVELYSLYSPKLIYSNNDFVSDYMWHINFAFLTLRKYKMFKVEEQQYFSQNSSFGAQNRQVKGGAIKALTENLQQLVQLIKVHLMPLLEEIKKSEFYYEWICKIQDNNDLIQENFLVFKKSNENSDKSFEEFLEFLKNDKKKEYKECSYSDIMDYKRKRDEAVKHLKDKWVSEVDGGTMWTLQKQQSEKGLDMVLLPQLFFGVELLDPLNTNTLEKQLDEYIYTIDITEDAKRQVSRFLYRFHMWLPTAVKDTKTTFKLKISALKQFYSQIQMYINFMKPLLLEISQKSEGYKSGGFFENSEFENPDILNLFDSSYNFVRVFAIKGLAKIGTLKAKDLSINDFGIYFDKTFKFVEHSEQNGSGYLIPKKLDLIKKDGKLCEAGEDEIKNDKIKKFIGYRFVECFRDISFEEYTKLLYEKDSKIYFLKEDLTSYAFLEFNFKNKRFVKSIETMQGPSQKPIQDTEVEYKGYCCDIVDIISYKESIKSDNLDLMSTFVSELNVIREDLEKYFNYFKDKTTKSFEKESEEENIKKKENKSSGFSDFFEGIKSSYGSLKESFKIFNIIKGERKTFESMLEENRAKTKKEVSILTAQTAAAHDVSKCYRIFKNEKGFWSYGETK